MENQWHRALYVLASSRSHTAPMARRRTDGSPFSVALGIVWPKTADGPSFRGAFTMNYNQQAVYYGIYAANHVEIGTPFYNAMLQEGRRTGRTPNRSSRTLMSVMRYRFITAFSPNRFREYESCYSNSNAAVSVIVVWRCL